MKLKSWITAARLRTLPLSLSGILLGSAIAIKQDYWNTWIFILAILTTLFFQILSNFANDLGDSYKGADNEHRLGPIRGIQAGIITQKQMRRAIFIMIFFSLVSAIPLVIIGTQGMGTNGLWFYLGLSLLCILAAITYTVGKKAYGYHGWGDVMVFIFFGIVSVLGVYGLYTKHFDFNLILPACTIGFLSMGVLNMNNMRDIENDKRVSKKTIVVALGFKRAKIYQSALIISSFITLLIYIILTQWYFYIIVFLPFIILFRHLIKVWSTIIPQDLDNELKIVSLSTFGIALLTLLISIL